MSANGFREDELVSRRMKVGNEWQTKVFPIIGGRLRLAHEENQSLSLQTEMVAWDGQYAVFKCRAVTSKGDYVGYGTANSQRDSRLVDSLIELAETRSIARALRFAGYGMEYTGAEEVSHVATAEPERVFPPGDNKTEKLAQPCANNGAQSKAPSDGIGSTETQPTQPRDTAGGNGSKPQRCGIGPATQAQVRALFALTKRANYTDVDVESLLRPLNASTFQELTREDASRLIGYLQTEVAA
jgi:hypothetical protein